MTARILIADDDRDVRSGFRLILDAQPDMTVIGEAADGAAAVDLARHLRPDVVLADIRMPRMNGLEVVRRLAGPGVPDPLRVIVVTTYDLDDYVHVALRDGACGFLLKRSGPPLLVEAVRAALAGDALVSPQITVRLLRHLTHPARPATSEDVTLSARESDIVRLVAEAKTNTEIAAELVVAPSTVKTHLANIQRKLGVRNRVGIAAWAWTHRERQNPTEPRQVGPPNP